jgi:hypothetical protein
MIPSTSGSLCLTGALWHPIMMPLPQQRAWWPSRCTTHQHTMTSVWHGYKCFYKSPLAFPVAMSKPPSDRLRQIAHHHNKTASQRRLTYTGNRAHHRCPQCTRPRRIGHQDPRLHRQHHSSRTTDNRRHKPRDRLMHLLARFTQAASHHSHRDYHHPRRKCGHI